MYMYINMYNALTENLYAVSYGLMTTFPEFSVGAIGEYVT